jgi:hypothetical protein
MSFKTTYILFGILAALFVVFGVALWRAPLGPDTSLYLFPGLNDEANPVQPESVDGVEIQRNRPEGDPVVFVRDPQTKRWQISRPQALPADSAAVDSLVRQVFRAKRDETAERPKDLQEVGLDQPARVLTLKRGDKEVARLKIGNDVAGPPEGGDLYVIPSDSGGDPVGVQRNQLDLALRELAYFRSRDLLGGGGEPGVGAAEVRALTVSERGKGTVELRKSDGENWRYVQPPYGAATSGDEEGGAGKAPGSVRPLLDGLRQLKVEYKDDKDNDFVADDVQDLARYHLDPAKDEVLRIKVERTETAPAEGEEEPARKVVQAELLVGVGKKAEGKGDKFYACLEGSRNVVRVSKAEVEPYRKLLDDPGSLRNRNLVEFTQSREPDAVDVRNSYGLLEFRRTGGPAHPAGFPGMPAAGASWELYRDGKAHAVDRIEVDRLIALLKEKGQVKSFPPASRQAELGLGKDKADATVTVWVDGLPRERGEKGKGKPALQPGAKPLAVLRFGSREGDLVAVERTWGKDSTLVMVPASVFDQVRKAPLAYFDRSLPEYNPESRQPDAGVTRLELRREGKDFVLTRAKDGAPWKIDKPAELTGRGADAAVVTRFLDTLSRLRAVEVAAEKATPAELDKTYNLKTPPYRAAVTVTKDGKSTSHEYDFGKESADKKGVYAKAADKDTIYVVGNDVLNTLKEDPVDRTVWDFEQVGDVSGLRLRGWRPDKAGTDRTLVLERSPEGKWVVKDPPNVDVDVERVAEFLRGLAHLKAERLVSLGKGPEPGQELTTAQGALEVEITVKDSKEKEGKKVLQLTVGGPDGDKAYFATSRQSGKDVFTVPRSLFEQVKKSRGYFIH